VLGDRFGWGFVVDDVHNAIVGIGLWVVYGFLKSDFVIIIANVVSLGLLMGILYFKLRDRPSPA